MSMPHDILLDLPENALAISSANPDSNGSLRNGLSEAEVDQTMASTSKITLATGDSEHVLRSPLLSERLTTNSQPNREKNWRKGGILREDKGTEGKRGEQMDQMKTTGDQFPWSLLPHEATQRINGDTGEQPTRDRRYSNTDKEPLSKLFPDKLCELTSSPKGLALQTLQNPAAEPRVAVDAFAKVTHKSYGIRPDLPKSQSSFTKPSNRKRSGSAVALVSPRMESIQPVPLASPPEHLPSIERPWNTSRAFSTPILDRRQSSNKIKTAGQPSLAGSRSGRPIPSSLEFETEPNSKITPEAEDDISSPILPSLPIPPLSFPAYLHLELSSDRPPPRVIYRSVSSEFPYESSRIKIERLLNFLFLPPALEQCLWFGALACLDAWLYTFTILPLRFLKAISILGGSWVHNLAKEINFMSGFIYMGVGRLWQRGFGGRKMASTDSSASHNVRSKEANETRVSANSTGENPSAAHSNPTSNSRQINGTRSRHRRTKSEPSALLPEHKADILKGLLLILTCTILMYFDASMMYHSIRGQATIKLYVIYNVLEVCWNISWTLLFLFERSRSHIGL
jgi:hypothetical protein